MAIKVALTLLLLTFVGCVKANFEDTRCRCICPNTQSFSTLNGSDNRRRYYAKTNIVSLSCNPQNVVKQSVKGFVDDNHMDVFLANCDCRYESRNTILLKVVVIFVICVLALLGSYMLFLTLLDPMFKRRRTSLSYKRQEDEIEENIFAEPSFPNGNAAASSSSSIPMKVSRNAATILEKVEVAQSNWQSDVENQRQKLL